MSQPTRGSRIKVLGGGFAGRTGTLLSLDGTIATIEVTVFGRSSNVEIALDQLALESDPRPRLIGEIETECARIVRLLSTIWWEERAVLPEGDPRADWRDFLDYEQRLRALHDDQRTMLVESLTELISDDELARLGAAALEERWRKETNWRIRSTELESSRLLFHSLQPAIEAKQLVEREGLAIERRRRAESSERL